MTRLGTLNRYLFALVDLRRYSALRIVFGFFSLIYFCEYFALSTRHLSDQGWLSREASQDLLASPAAWSVFYSIGSPWGVRVVLGLGVLAAVGMMIGFFSRACTGATFIIIASVINRNIFLAYGGDDFLRAMVFYLVFSPCGERWSVDSWLNRPVPMKLEGSAWPLRFIQTQVAIVYFFAGFWKLHGDDWLHGRAVRLLLLNPDYARFDFYALAQQSSIGRFALDFASRAGSIVPFWEASFPVLLLFRRSRTVSLAFGVIVHLMILICLDVHYWSLLILASYLAFIPEGWFYGVIDRKSGAS